MAVQEVVFIVDPDGGAGSQYDSLLDWEAFEVVTSLIADDQRYTVKCRSTAGGADVFGAEITSTWVTDNTHYIKVWTDPTESYRHNGTYQTGKHRVEITGDWWQNTGQFVRFIGLQFQTTATAAGIRGLMATAGNTIIENCVFKAVLSSLAGGATEFNCVRIEGASPTARVVNCIAYDAINGTRACHGFRANASGTPVITFHNCTAQNCYRGFHTETDDAEVKNCIGQDCGTACFSGTFTSGSDFNASDDSTGPGANSVVGEVTFANEGADDFHLAAADTVARNAGTDLSGATYPITTDIDGQTRSAWDIGADEIGFAQSVPVDELALTLSIEDVTIAATATVAVDALSLASSLEDVAVVPGSATVAVDPLSLASSLENVTVVPGAVAIPVDALALALSIQDVSIVTGTATVVVDPLTIASSLGDITTLAGAVSVLVDALSVALTAATIDVLPGGVSITVDPLALAAALGDVGVENVGGGDQTIPVDALSLTVAAGDIAVAPGEVSVGVGPLALTIAIQDVVLLPGTVSLLVDPLTLTVSLEDVSVVNVGGADIVVELQPLAIQTILAAIHVQGGVFTLPEGAFLVPRQQRIFLVPARPEFTVPDALGDMEVEP